MFDVSRSRPGKAMTRQAGTRGHPTHCPPGPPRQPEPDDPAHAEQRRPEQSLRPSGGLNPGRTHQAPGHTPCRTDTQPPQRPLNKSGVRVGGGSPAALAAEHAAQEALIALYRKIGSLRATAALAHRAVFGTLQRSGSVLVDAQGVVRHAHSATLPTAGFDRAGTAALGAPA